MPEPRDLGPLYHLLDELFPERNHHGRLNVTHVSKILDVRKQHLYAAMKEGVPPGLALRILNYAKIVCETPEIFESFYERLQPLLTTR